MTPRLYIQRYPSMTIPDTVSLKGDEFTVFIQEDDRLFDTVPFDKGRWDALIEKLLSIGVGQWKSEYVDHFVDDGESWELLVNDPRLRIRARGHNMYPGPKGELLSPLHDHSTQQYDLVWEAVRELIAPIQAGSSQ